MTQVSPAFRLQDTPAVKRHTLSASGEAPDLEQHSLQPAPSAPDLVPTPLAPRVVVHCHVLSAGVAAPLKEPLLRYVRSRRLARTTKRHREV
jgi:hypothetical protein